MGKKIVSRLKNGDESRNIATMFRSTALALIAAELTGIIAVFIDGASLAVGKMILLLGFIVFAAVRCRHFPRSWKDIMLLPRGFCSPAENRQREFFHSAVQG